MAHCSEGGCLKKKSENLILIRFSRPLFLPNALANGVGKEGRWPHSCKVPATIHLDVHWEGEDVPSPFAILQWPKAIDDDATAALKKRERKHSSADRVPSDYSRLLFYALQSSEAFTRRKRRTIIYKKVDPPIPKCFRLLSRLSFALRIVYAGGVLVCVCQSYLPVY